MPKPVVVVSMPAKGKPSGSSMQRTAEKVERVFKDAGWGVLILVDMNSVDFKFDVVSVNEAEVKSFERLKDIVEATIPELGVRELDLD